jgi:type VI protein secretion system component Hcp
MEQFTNLLNKFNNRIVNVEVQILNSKAPSDTQQVSLSFGTVNETFKNSNNKRIRTMETVRDKEVDIFIRPTNVET